MKNYLTTLGLTFIAFLSSAQAFAQIDVDSLMYGNSFNKITERYGQPLERYDYEGEGGNYIWLTYNDFYTVLDQETNNISAITFWTDDMCVLSSYVKGGIKVGDRASTFKDVDFSKLVTGKHYEPCGIVVLETPYPNVYDSFFNYGILSRGKPYRIDFAVEDNIIKAIRVFYLDDDTEPEDYEDEENIEAEHQYQTEW